MRWLSQSDADFDRQLHQALQIDEATSQEIEASVDAILAEVREGGDTALTRLVAQYDGIARDAVADLSISKMKWLWLVSGFPQRSMRRCSMRRQEFEAITNASMRSKRPIGALRTSSAMCWDKGLVRWRELESMRPGGKHLIPQRS